MPLKSKANNQDVFKKKPHKKSITKTGRGKLKPT